MSKWPGRRFVAFAPPLQFYTCDGMDGVEMAGNQAARLALFRMAGRGTAQPANTLPSGRCDDGRTQDSHLARGESSMRSTRLYPLSDFGIPTSCEVPASWAIWNQREDWLGS